MKKVIVKILMGFSVTVVLVMGLLAGGAYIYRGKLEALILQQINERVSEPVVIKGGIRFSLLKHFPFASITLSDVSIKNKFNAGPEYLLNVKELSCLFNIWELRNRNIQISRIHIYDGEVNIYMNAKGDGDFDIFLPSADTTHTIDTSTSSLRLNLRKAVVKNVHFTYLTENKEEDIALKIEKMTLGGNFADERFDMETNEKMIIEVVRLNGSDYLTRKSFNSNITIDVDQKNSKFTLNKADLELDNNRFDVTGYFASARRSTYVDFTADTKGKDIAKLIALVPVKFKSSLDGATGSGGFQVYAKVTGNITTGVNPDIAVDAKLDKAKITIPRIGKPLMNVTVDAYYHMNPTGDDELDIRKFHSEFDGEPQNFTLRLTHLSDPDFIFNADGVANLHDLKVFFSDSTLQEVEGFVAFDSFHIEGSKKVLTEPTNPKFKASGKFALKNVEVKTGGIKYKNINGDVTYEDRNITIKGFTIGFLGTDIAFDGHIDRLLAYALSRDRRTNTEDVPLGLNGDLRIKTLDIAKMISAYSGPASPAPVHHDTAGAAAAPSSIDLRDLLNIQGQVTISIDKLIYQKIAFQNMKADLSLSPYRIDMTSLTTQAMGGDIYDSGYVALTADHKMIFDFGLDIDSLDLPVVLNEFDNFSQATLTDKNLKGRITADLELHTVWNNYTDIDMDQLQGHLSCHVTHGELNNFGPIKSAASYIKLDELNHVVFADLATDMILKTKSVAIQKLEVQSSALNMMMAGTHTMDNVMDYSLKVNLRKLLAAKFGKKENSDEHIEDNPYEGINLYLTVRGPIAQPEIKYNKKAVKEKLKNVLDEQQAELSSPVVKHKKHRKPGDKKMASL